MPGRHAVRSERTRHQSNPTMPRLLGAALVLLTGCLPAVADLPPNPNEVNDRWYDLKHGGKDRRYLVHTPSQWDGRQPLPVVLAFHGGGVNAETQRTQSGLNAKSDTHGFLVVYPDGTGPTVRKPGKRRVGVYTWNAGLCCGSAVQNRVDDVGFVRALLDDLPKHFAIDATRVYATGMSNGSMMAHRIGVELADRIAAIAPVAGSLMITDLNLRPSRPVPIMYFHGRKDPSAQFDGGPGRLDKTVHRSVPETLTWWIHANSCVPQPVAVEQHDDYVLRRFAPFPGRSSECLTFVLLPEGGHTWPGGVDVTAGMGTGALIESVDASEMMWRFFAQHRLDGRRDSEAPGPASLDVEPHAAQPADNGANGSHRPAGKFLRFLQQ